MAASRLRFGPFEADLTSGELWHSGARIRVQEQPFQVLAALLERPGEVVTREDLRSRIWSSDTFVDFDHSLNTAINKLRDALGDSAAAPRYIETLPRRGYRFLAPVVSVGGAAPAGPADELPRAPRAVARSLFALIQGMYLAFYVVALWRLERLDAVHSYLGGTTLRALALLLIVTAAVGIAARLYFLACVVFDFGGAGRQFRRVFLPLAVLDELWALAPLLLWPFLGVGLAFAAVAALLFLPFSQRNLVRMAYPVSR